MSDVSSVGPEGETPVNPYSLLEAVNSSSDAAHTAWLIFLALMTYLTVAVAGVNHVSLLLDKAVPLPILQVSVPLTQFFQFASVILVLLHLGVVGQLVLLARKTLEFDQAIRLLELTDRRTHPLRLELHNFFFVQAIAGPHRSVVMSAFLHTMSWLTLVILPVLLLLYIQFVFVPYHDVDITWIHRVALSVDIAMLVLIGVFLLRAEASFFSAFWRSARGHPVSLIATGMVMLLTAYLSFFVATIPGETLDRAGRAMSGHGMAEDVFGARQRQVAGFAMPLLTPRADGTLFGFHRNLVVVDTDLVVDKDVSAGEASLNLRGRDLRYARLDRSDLHQADFTGADLSGASLMGADLRGVRMSCSDLNELLLGADREAARCVNARRANFSRADMTAARLIGIDLRGAKLEEAKLEAAELSSALLTGANFASAKLEKAELVGGVQAQGANFLVASLQGADLTGAQLQFADFSSSALQGAVLTHAHLQGAVLRDAELEGADLYQAKLQGADMTGAKLRAADLRGAAIWMTAPADGTALQLADLTDMVVKPLDELDVAALQRAIERAEDGRPREQVRDALAQIMKVPESRAWATSNEVQTWQRMIAAAAGQTGDVYKAQITEYLTRVGCKARWGTGSVATGLARRAQGQQFRGDLLAVYDKLRGPDCPPARNVDAKAMQGLTQAADIARSN